MAAVLTRDHPPVPPAHAGHSAAAVPPEDDAPLPLTVAERAYVSGQFATMARRFPDLRMELTAEGTIVIMAPAHTETGHSNFNIAVQLGQWIMQGGGGYGFDSSTGFTLPDGSELSPDASWIAKERWDALTKQRKSKFAQICPDFVIELRSGSDRLSTLQKKMLRYLDNGVRLGWLLDPRLRRAEIYRAGRDVEVSTNPLSLSGEDVLPGFVLDLTDIFTE